MRTTTVWRLSVAAVAVGAMASGAAGQIVTGNEVGPAANVKTFGDVAGNSLTSTFLPYGVGFTGGVRVAAGDIDGDKIPDVITGVGTGSSHVKVFSAPSGVEIRSFFAYAGFAGGVFVAAGDVNNDGRADVVTGTDAGVSPHVKAFDGVNGSEIRSFFAYGGNFAGGVRVAAGDVDGDGFADIVTGAGAGGNSHVKAFSGATGIELRSFFAYDNFSGGVFVAAGDVNHDGLADIVTGADEGAPPQVKVFDSATGQTIRSFFAFAPGFTGGVRVASADLNGDKFADIIAGAGANGAGHVKVFDGATGNVIGDFLAYGSSYTGGVFVGSGGVPGRVPEPAAAALFAAALLGVAPRLRSASV